MDLYLVNNKIPSAVWKTNDINHIYDYINQFRMDLLPSELMSFVRYCCRNKTPDAVIKLKQFMKLSPSTNNESYLRTAIEEQAAECARVIVSFGYTRICRLETTFKTRYPAQQTLITELCLREETNMLFKRVCATKNIANIALFLEAHTVDVQYCHYAALIDICRTKEAIDLFMGKFTIDSLTQACVFENLVNHRHMELAAWFLNTHAPTAIVGDVTLNLYFNDQDAYDDIVDSIEEPCLLNIDDCMMYQAHDGEWREIMILHTLGYRFQDHIDVVIMDVCEYQSEPNARYNDVLEWFIDTYDEWFQDHPETQQNVFYFACAHMSLPVIQMLYQKWKPFTAHTDALYMECIENSGERNMEVARWLAEMFGEYYIDETAYPDCTVYELKKIPQMGKIYRQIAQHPNQGRQLLEIIGGTPHREPCVVCYDEPDDMVQLNCGHYTCMFCISNWYAKNDEKCPYCRTTTQWIDCKAVRTRKQIVEDALEIP